MPKEYKSTVCLTKLRINQHEVHSIVTHSFLEIRDVVRKYS